MFQFPSNGKVYPKFGRSRDRRHNPLRVSIPFKRESVSKETQSMRRRPGKDVAGFNSLQTGKCIQSAKATAHNNIAKRLFQFPSNGKVYPKITRVPRHQLHLLSQVSIPFKRESVSKVKMRMPLGCSTYICFNSLQTGKCIQRKIMECQRQEFASFNSLQTGKCIQSDFDLGTVDEEEKFQFPSNGKVYPKTRMVENVVEGLSVSIPFKRESVSKVIKFSINLVKIKIRVSIPFKRESVSKAFPKTVYPSVQTAGFNSLQTGKCIQSMNNAKRHAKRIAEFQFPSNGKVYPKPSYDINTGKW